jgi:mRNA-degrading endonuclease RelE of RelBE toxin-antitoxin system
MYRLEFEEPARRQLRKIGQRTPELARGIAAKIQWLQKHAARIKHEKMQTSPECSLHIGGYRVLYLVEHDEESIVVRDIDRHDAAYRRLRLRG